MTSSTRVVFLFGNGLSRGLSDQFALGSITERVLSRLDQPLRDVLHELTVLGSPEDAARPARDVTGFEQIAGPLDRVAEAMLALAPIAARTKGMAGPLWETYTFLREHYLSLTGLVLTDIAALSRNRDPQEWSGVNAFAKKLLDVAKSHAMAIFTVNYDTVLLSSLLQAGKWSIYDGFPFMRFDPFLLSWSRIPFYHLHGSVTWFQTDEGMIRKATTDSVKHGHLLEAWASGDDGDGLPVVVLGDAKEHQIGRPPFVLIYSELRRWLESAPLLVAGGFSFGDLPLNSLIASWLADNRHGEDRRLEIWSPSAESEKGNVLNKLNACAPPRLKAPAIPDSQVTCKNISLPDEEALTQLARTL